MRSAPTRSSSRRRAAAPTSSRVPSPGTGPTRNSTPASWGTISGHEILRPHACRSIGSGQEDEGVEGQQHDRQVPGPAGRAEIAPHGGPVLNRGAAAAPGAVRQGREQFVDQGTIVQLVVCDAAPDVDVAVVPLVDPVELGDAEDVDGPVRRRAPASRVHQDVGAAGEDQKAGVVVQDPQGLVEGLRGEPRRCARVGSCSISPRTSGS